MLFGKAVHIFNDALTTLGIDIFQIAIVSAGFAFHLFTAGDDICKDEPCVIDADSVTDIVYKDFRIFIEIETADDGGEHGHA